MQGMAEIVFLNGDREGDSLPLEASRTVFGRQVGDILLPDSEVSSIHAIISYERGGWYVMDLGSTNGVFVEERMRLEARLKDGEELRLGKTRLRFHLIASGELGSPAAVDAAAAETRPIEFPEVSGSGSESRTRREEVIDDLGPDHPAHRIDTQKFSRDEVLGAMTASGGVQVTIEILEGAERGAVRHFKQESILIGRLNTDLVLRDSDVSRRHAIIEVFDASQVYLRDLNSTNGCRVNDNRVISERLQNGDELRIGRCVLRFSARVLYPEKD